MSPSIISFMGPVGVGKSTQIKLLQKRLKSKKVKTVKTFIKSNHIFAHITIRFLTLVGAYKNPLHQDGLSVIYINKRIVERLYPILILLDAVSITIKFFFTVYIPFHMGFNVLIEEGLMMSLFTYTLANPKIRGLKSKTPPFLLRLISWILKQKHVNIILDAENKELILRRKNRNYRQKESPEYVDLQKKWLKQLNYGNTIFLETTNLPIIQVHEVIVAAIEKYADLA
jgi:energy-coupling factor transporter ATP-binding protein EcfA2